MGKKKPQEKAKLTKQDASWKSLPWYSNKTQLTLILAVLAITFICFSPALSSKKEFTNWDDPVYVTQQELITKLDAKHVKTMFNPKHDVSLNYHPLTMLSLAVNYNFSKLKPYGYFLTNILFHLFNTFLVFLFLYRLSGKKFWVGLIPALLFGIHPMHVESVAWISERKDVLYCFFFLASCITYLSFIETKNIKYLIICFLLFFASCLSKAMAVPLPLVLLLIDYYKQRKFTVKSIAEKLPFFLLAAWIGLTAVHIQSKEAIADFQTFTLFQRFMFASYGFMMYWIKLFVPVGLSTFYPYPSLINGDVPLLYKITPVVALAIIAVPGFVAYKKNKETFRMALFGIGFFVVTVALVLQFISVGAAIMADRYSYVPYIGAFFIIASLANNYFEKKGSKNIALVILSVITLALGLKCYNSVVIWNDNEKLWTNVIEKYPYVIEQTGNTITVKKVGVTTAYKNRGNYYREKGEMEKAFADYDVLVRARAKDDGAYSNMGNFYGLKGQEALAKGDKQLAEEKFSKALEMYSEAIKIKPGNFETMLNRGITYSSMGDHKKAIDDFNEALRINPTATNLLGNLAFEKTQIGLYKEAIEDCNKALASNPDDANVLLFKGTAEINLGKFNDAVNSLTLSLKINPSSGNGWFNLSYAYNKIGNRRQALDAAVNAKKYGYAVSDQYLQELQSVK